MRNRAGRVDAEPVGVEDAAANEDVGLALHEPAGLHPDHGEAVAEHRAGAGEGEARPDLPDPRGDEIADRAREYQSAAGAATRVQTPSPA